MPKSGAERARVHIARKRQRARDAGFCVRCCKVRPSLGLLTCTSCNASALERQKRKRHRMRQLGLSVIIEAHERAGDVAREHLFYEAAAQHYEDALRVPDANEAAWIRLSEKLAEVLWFGNEPGAASVVNDRLLAMYRLHPERSAEHIKTLFKVALQLWVDSRTKDRIPVLSKAIRIAELSSDLKLLQQANIRMANTFMQLARFEEADHYIRAVGKLHVEQDLGTHIDYHIQKGWIAAGLGMEKEAFVHFERAIRVTRANTNPYTFINLWADYGLLAWQFGQTNLAKTHLEHGLLAARQNNFAWLIPKCCLGYAEFLTFIGEYASAHEYLLEALSSDVQTPIVDEMIAYVGIPLALYMKDEAALAKCVRPHVIDRVFLSGEPTRIGLVAAAFARLYVERGQNRKAQALLHRAIEAMHNAVHALEFPLEVARCGAKADFPKARRLLEVRVALPSPQVAEAYLHLFEAFVAQREGRYADAHAQARDAATRFNEFQWDRYSNLARSLLPEAEQHLPASELRHAKPFSNTNAKITKREREVATLVLKGLTNRAIADVLSITENTVEKHVAAVMNKFGIRSRYQLADTILEVTV